MNKFSLKNVPLDCYQCTFFLPLVGLSEEDFNPQDAYIQQYCAGSTVLSKAEKQAYHYFSPTLRRILFECEQGKGSQERKIKPVREWRLPDAMVQPLGLYLEPQQGADKPSYSETIKTSIESVRLFRYFNGIYVLAYRVVAENITQQSDLETWLHFTRLARLLYPSFPEQVAENKIAPLCIYDEDDRELARAFDQPSIAIPEHMGEQLSGIVRFFLKAFAGDPNALDAVLDRYDTLYDDRMFVSVAYGLKDYESLSKKYYKQILYLATWVDRVEDIIALETGFAYAESALDRMTKDKLSTLWQELGGVFSFTSYSNVYLYNNGGGFFNKYMVPNHIPFIYDRMLVQALFYQASLRCYDEQISTDTADLLKEGKVGDIRQQRRDFIRFTNQYWFHSLTEQMQGKRIFELQTQGLELQAHYEVIKDELERTDEYLQTENSRTIETLTTRLSYGGFVVGFLALYYAVLPLVDSWIKAGDEKASLWNVVDAYSFLPSWFVVLLLAPVVLGTLLLGTWRWGKQAWHVLRGLRGCCRL